jgi:hypothetical protein
MKNDKTTQSNNSVLIQPPKEQHCAQFQERFRRHGITKLSTYLIGYSVQLGSDYSNLYFNPAEKYRETIFHPVEPFSGVARSSRTFVNGKSNVIIGAITA